MMLLRAQEVRRLPTPAEVFIDRGGLPRTKCIDPPESANHAAEANASAGVFMPSA